MWAREAHILTCVNGIEVQQASWLIPLVLASCCCRLINSHTWHALCLSVRDAVWRETEQHLNNANWTTWYGWHDFLHPTKPGHAATAEMVVWQLQQLLIKLQLDPWSDSKVVAWQQTLAVPPPPMYAGNYEGVTRVCLHGASVKELVRDRVGWELVNEGSDGKQKWGYIAEKPGATLVLEVNTTRERGSDQAPYMTLLLSHLKSYEHMGMATVR